MPTVFLELGNALGMVHHEDWCITSIRALPLVIINWPHCGARLKYTGSRSSQSPRAVERRASSTCPGAKYSCPSRGKITRVRTLSKNPNPGSTCMELKAVFHGRMMETCSTTAKIETISHRSNSQPLTTGNQIRRSLCAELRSRP